MDKTDTKYMRMALRLAARGRGRTSPNPLVGAVIVQEGRIVGQGFHARAGKDHAEIAALKQCTADSRGATLYVTLEPCVHYGKTPPCVDAIIKSGIGKVIFAMEDPNPLVCGKGAATLRKNGIQVQQGVLEAEARELNKVFCKYITTGKPYVFLKAAITLDGKIATSSGDSKWISGEEARKWVHQRRSEVDAIMVGKGTVLQDDPQLTSRLKEEKFPLRIVLAHKAEEIEQNAKVLKGKGMARIMSMDNLGQGLKVLGGEGVTSVLVEGGSSVFSQFISQQEVDEFYFFIAPLLMGDTQGIPLFVGGRIDKIKDCFSLKVKNVERVGGDVLVVAVPQQNI